MVTALLLDFYNVLFIPTGEGYVGNVNKELLDMVVQNTKSLHHHVFTSSSPKHKELILKIIGPTFTSIQFAKEIGLPKETPEAYLEVVQRIGMKPDEVLFIDDSIANVNAATSAGLLSVQYVSNQQIKNTFESYNLK